MIPGYRHQTEGKGKNPPPQAKPPSRGPTGRRGRGPGRPGRPHPGRGGAAQGDPDPDPGGGATRRPDPEREKREGERTK